MDMPAFLNSPLYIYGVLPLLIFVARIADVSLDTLRIIFINRSLRYLAAFFGFVQVLIWLMVIRQIFQSLDNPLCYIAYAGGFAAGNIIGLIIENRLSIGRVIIRTITRREGDALVEYLRSSGFGVTAHDATGATGPVKVIFTIVERSDIPSVVETIKRYNPNAFYSVEDVRFVSEAVTPHRLPATRRWRKMISRTRTRV